MGGGGGGGGADLMALGMGVSPVPWWAQPAEPRIKAAPTKQILTKFEVFIVSKLFGEAAAHLAQAGCEQLPDI
jgi:hypothetical protein